MPTHSTRTPTRRTHHAHTQHADTHPAHGVQAGARNTDTHTHTHPQTQTHRRSMASQAAPPPAGTSRPSSGQHRAAEQLPREERPIPAASRSAGCRSLVHTAKERAGRACPRELSRGASFACADVSAKAGCFCKRVVPTCSSMQVPTLNDRVRVLGSMLHGAASLVRGTSKIGKQKAAKA
jgi:transcription initiation factor TFIID subunit TAF12